MAYCGQCGSRVYEGDQFCGYCGASVLLDEREDIPGASEVEDGLSDTPQPNIAPSTVYQEPNRRSRSVLLFSSIAMLIMLLTVAAIFGLTRFNSLGGVFGGSDAPAGGEVSDTPEANTPPTTIQEQQTVDEGSSTMETTSPGYLSTSEVVLYEEFGGEYVDAVRDEDWEKTYSMLDETSQEEFTEEE